jgi:hypothetical protein
MRQLPSLLLRTMETRMQSKPDFLGDEAAAFQDAEVAAYQPSYRSSPTWSGARRAP